MSGEIENKVNNDGLITTSLEHIILKGSKLNASYIHIEPREKYLLIRYRVGSELEIGTKLPIAIFNPMLEMLKEKAGLSGKGDKKVFEKKIKLSDSLKQPVDMTIVPTLSGEKIIFKLPNVSTNKSELSKLGFWGENLYLIRKDLQQTKGMTIISSPKMRNSAQSFSYLSDSLDFPGMTIASIGKEAEDVLPKSFKIKITPGSLNNKYADHKRLKLIIKRQPNAIFISQPEDSKIIDLAFIESDKRSIFLAITSSSIVNTLQLILAIEPPVNLRHINLLAFQIEANRLCKYCKESFSPSQAQINNLAVKDYNVLHELESQAYKDGVGKDIIDLSSNKEGIVKLFKASKSGCDHCNHKGYLDTINLVEVIDVKNQKIGSLVNSLNVSLSNINKFYEGLDHVSLRTDSIIKCLRGQIDFGSIL